MIDQPSLTVKANIFNKFVHPNTLRYITRREAARLQDIPLKYKSKVAPSQVHNQIGNAVPVRFRKSSCVRDRPYFQQKKEWEL